MKDFDDVTIELGGAVQKGGQSVAIHHVRATFTTGVRGNYTLVGQNSVLLWREGKARHLLAKIDIKITTAQGNMLLRGWVDCSQRAPIYTDEGVLLEVFPERHPI
jgi:hypothetical protein